MALKRWGLLPRHSPDRRGYQTPLVQPWPFTRPHSLKVATGIAFCLRFNQHLQGTYYVPNVMLGTEGDKYKTREKADSGELLRTSPPPNLLQPGWALQRLLAAGLGNGSGLGRQHHPCCPGDINTMPNSGLGEAVSRTFTLPSLTKGP